MREGNRVFITGRSALTASGHSADLTWAAICAGQSGLGHIKQWDLSGWPSPIGGELLDFQPAKMLPDRKLLKVISRQDVMGINAGMQAIEDSQLLHFRENLADPEAFNHDTAVFVGSPGNKYFQQYDFLPLLAKTNGNMQAFADQLFNEVHPMWLLRILPNNVLAHTGIHYGFKGVNHNVTNHAVGGTQALIEAYHAVASGKAARAVVIAYDIGIEPQALFYYDKLGVLSDSDLKPFDASHNGTLLAEGAAALILESEASVSTRGAQCYGEIVGGLAKTEAQGLFNIEADGEHLRHLLNDLLQHASIKPENIGLVVAHGNGNPKSDVSEAQALQALWPDNMPPVTAFKWAMGHTLTASGVIDAVMTTYSLNEHYAPGIPNLQNLASLCHGLNASNEGRELTLDKPYALLINRGFASMNACVLIKWM